jgi:foldase protein PrsA
MNGSHLDTTVIVDQRASVQRPVSEERPSEIRAQRLRRTQRLRFTAVLSAALVAVIGLSACGGVPSDAVVQVNGSPITKATFDHWMGVAAASTKTSATSKAVPPEPPDYTACVSHLASTSAKPAKGHKAPSAAELKSQCEQQYKSLERSVLAYLISADWVIDEGSSLGIKLSDAEVKKEFVKEKVAQYPEITKFQLFLQNSGETVSDLLLTVKLRLLQQKIEQRAIKGKGSVTQTQVETYYRKHKSQYGRQPLSKVQATIKQQLAETREQTAFTEFVKNFKKKWLAKTECRSGYVVADCKQYKASKARGSTP